MSKILPKPLPSDAEVLKLAIETVLERGFNMEEEWGYELSFWKRRSEAERIVFCERLLKKDYTNYKCIIYNHEFAKKLFGEEEYIFAIYPNGEYDGPSGHWHSPQEWEEVMADDDRIDESLIDEDMPAWKYHLKEMVTEKDDINYLRTQLKEQKLC